MGTKMLVVVVGGIREREDNQDIRDSEEEIFVVGDDQANFTHEMG